MRYLSKTAKGLSGLLVLVGLIVGLAFLFNTQQNQPQTFSSAPPTPTAFISPILPPLPTAPPPNHTPSYTGTPATATPLPGEIRPTAEFFTPTPLPISKIIDLAEGLPDEEIYVFIVRRSDGTYEKYLIPIDRWEDRAQLMELGAQDVIVYGNPLVLLPPSTPQVTPLPITPVITTTATPISSLEP